MSKSYIEIISCYDILISPLRYSSPGGNALWVSRVNRGAIGRPGTPGDVGTILTNRASTDERVCHSAAFARICLVDVRANVVSVRIQLINSKLTTGTLALHVSSDETGILVLAIVHPVKLRQTGSCGLLGSCPQRTYRKQSYR